MSKLESAQYDLAFWKRKFEKVPSNYHKAEMIKSRDRLQRAQWDHERRQTVRQ